VRLVLPLGMPDRDAHGAVILEYVVEGSLSNRRLGLTISQQASKRRLATHDERVMRRFDYLIFSPQPVNCWAAGPSAWPFAVARCSPNWLVWMCSVLRPAARIPTTSFAFPRVHFSFFIPNVQWQGTFSRASETNLCPIVPAQFHTIS
jgi:hypothetical protein